MARASLIVAGIVELVFRGIPALIGTPAIGRMFHLQFDLVLIPYVHAFGAVMIVLGVLFLAASRVPERNLLIVNIAILRFLLGILAQGWTYVEANGLATFWWINMAVDVFLVVFLLAGRSKLVARIV
jgi:hypothetical protein